jgi:hypothetical protein
VVNAANRRNLGVCVMELRPMAKDSGQPPQVADLSDAEIKRIEAALFCAGGPPKALTPRLAERASGQPCSSGEVILGK